MARDPQNLHGPALLSQCPQDAPQHPQPSLFALSLLRSYKGLTVGDQTKVTSILLSSQLPRRLRLPPRSLPQKSCIWQPLWPPKSTAGLLSFPSPHQPLPPSAPRTQIHPYYFECFRLGAPAASPPGAPKHSGTCASNFPYSTSASPPSRQPLSCSLPWQPPPSIIQA